MIYTLDVAALPVGYGEALLPLEAAKAHLRVIEDDEDGLIEALRDAAIEMVEQFTGLILGPRSGGDAMVWRAESLPAGACPIRLGVRPVVEPVSMTWLDSAGAAQAMDAGSLRIVDGDSIVPAAGGRWPGDVAGGVVVTFAAGLATDKAPAGLIAAAKMFMATLYAQRETIVTGGAQGELTHGFKMLCQRYRRLRV